MDLQDSEPLGGGQPNPATVRRTDFSIESLLKRKDPEQPPRITDHSEFIVDAVDEDEVNFHPYCTQIESNYDSEQEASVPSSPEAHPILDVKDNSSYLGLTEDDLKTFSWLSCTRFKPPRLPRSKKRSGCKRYGRGPRIPFAPHQISVLESTFSTSHYLSSDCIHSLADRLHLSETRVKIWFQNRRARFRREKEASTMSQNETPHFYAHPQQSPPSPTVARRHLTTENSSGTQQQPQMANYNVKYSEHFLNNHEAAAAEDLSSSKRKLLIPDFISQQLHQYRQVQEYFRRQQDQQLSYNQPIYSAEDGRQISNPSSPQGKSLFQQPPTSILHSVLQSSSSGQFFSGISKSLHSSPESSITPHTPEPARSRFLQLSNTAFSSSAFPLHFTKFN